MTKQKTRHIKRKYKKKQRITKYNKYNIVGGADIIAFLNKYTADATDDAIIKLIFDLNRKEYEHGDPSKNNEQTFIQEFMTLRRLPSKKINNNAHLFKFMIFEDPNNADLVTGN
jgi:hypothetical protein